MNRNLILEIGTEEIPARFMKKVLQDLQDFTAAEFQKERIECGQIESFATPRRLVLSVKALAERQSDLKEDFKGPAWKACFDASGSPSRAAQGFAKGRGIAVEDLECRPVGNVDYAFAVISQEGRPVEAVLPDVLLRVISKLTFPKNMYWHEPSVRFARPVRWILCLLGNDVVPFTWNGLASGRTSRGHRFLGAKTVDVKNADAYLTTLYDEYVIVDQNKRQEKMLSGIANLERSLGGHVELAPELVEENLYLVEYPVPFAGSFDARYLEIPEEVLITSMKVNQKYFPVRSAEGTLLPCFVAVSNNRPASMDLVREGNERVLRARLDDAVFFWEEDLKLPLSALVEKLHDVVYQEKLGSVYDKVLWMGQCVAALADKLGLTEEKPLVERAARLSKSDLVTFMVGEFPELQGVIGRAYAEKNGEDPRVALALEEQYLPRSADGELPSDVVGALVGLAERLFTMIGAYKVGLHPTGSQDPYGLRRAIRCINAILWGLKLDLDFLELLRQQAATMELSSEQCDALVEFVTSRTFGQFKEQGFDHDLVDLATTVTGHNPWQSLQLLKAFVKVRNEDWFAALITAAVRVKNILAKSEPVNKAVDSSCFVKDAERNLSEAANRLETALPDVLARHDWNQLMELLASLSPAVTAFFDDVMVMDDDEAIRTNRLALLEQCHRLFVQAGDLSKARE